MSKEIREILYKTKGAAHKQPASLGNNDETAKKKLLLHNEMIRLKPI